MNDHFGHQRKVRYFSRFNENVRLNAPEQYKLEGYYLPNWENDNFWKKWYRIKSAVSDNRSGEIFKEKYPTPEHFRDYCFAEAKKDEDINTCGNGGWCEACFWKPAWDKEYPD